MILGMVLKKVQKTQAQLACVAIVGDFPWWLRGKLRRRVDARLWQCASFAMRLFVHNHR